MAHRASHAIDRARKKLKHYFMAQNAAPASFEVGQIVVPMVGISMDRPCVIERISNDGLASFSDLVTSMPLPRTYMLSPKAVRAPSMQELNSFYQAYHKENDTPVPDPDKYFDNVIKL